MTINLVDHGYLDRQCDFLKKTACLIRKSITNKEYLSCVPGLLLKRYHINIKVSSNNISLNMRFIRNNQTMKQISRHLSTIKHRRSSE